MLQISPTVSIPDAELEERFVRASGPGGQNVNKLSTAVELRFDIARSPSLDDALRARVLARRDRRVDGNGVILISAQRFRTQERNREDARARLAALIQSVLTPPRPRVATKPTRASKERRLKSKSTRANVKGLRTGRAWKDEA